MFIRYDNHLSGKPYDISGSVQPATAISVMGRIISTRKGDKVLDHSNANVATDIKRRENSGSKRCKGIHPSDALGLDPAIFFSIRVYNKFIRENLILASHVIFTLFLAYETCDPHFPREAL
jgi:hypothetical protein